MDDLISRSHLIESIEKDGMPIPEWLRGKIESEPSAEPERKKGKWIPHEDEDGEHYGDKCSKCGEWYVMPYGKTNFCPICEEDMRGEEL